MISESVKKANALGVCNKLVSAYLWRSICTDRYEAKANDRLFEDYKALQECIKQIRETGTFSHDDTPPIFDEEEYPLPNTATLGIDEVIPWIKGSSRLGRAIAALTLSQVPSEWLTNDQLNTRRVRELARAGDLDRHHVFPRSVLKDRFSKQVINHGLNGVLLSRRGNQALSKKDPAEYMAWILKQPKAPKEKELRRRVESHFVPYDIITGNGSVEERYVAFIEERAQRVAQAIRERTELPGD